MKAILTKYHGATNHRAARISAVDSDGNRVYVSIPNDQSFGDDCGHRKAAEALRDKMGWSGQLIGGGIKGGMAFVFAE